MTNPESRRKVAAARPRVSDEDMDEILPSIEEVLRSGWLILGEHTRAFERAFAQSVGTEHAVAVSSCSAALQIVLRFFGVEGREVLMPANNFPGVLSAALYEGGTPVLAEMNPSTFCVDTEDLLTRITPRTVGVIVVHIAGFVSPDIDLLRDVCRQKGLFLLEDASHAHGAAIGDRRVGSLADVGCFSFYPTKILTSGTGGMITTDNEDLVNYARSLRHHGMGRRRDQFMQLGSDWCMSELHAVLGLSQLSHLEEFVEHRNRVVEWYREGLEDEDWLTIPTHPPEIRHAYYKLPTVVSEDVDRDLLRSTLENEMGIENGVVYDPPCHLQPAFKDLLGIGKGTFPKAERTLARQFCPPVHSAITRDDVNYVISSARDVIDRCRVAGTAG